jgi:hypothetical protein
MCVSEIFEQKMPFVTVRVPGRLEAARDQTRRHHGSKLRVERDLLAAGVKLRLHPLGQSGLEDEPTWRISGGAFAGEPQPNDPGQDRRTRALHRDIGNVTITENTGFAQDLGQMVGLRCCW